MKLAFLAVLSSLAIVPSVAQDPVQEHQHQFYVAINHGDTDKMEIILRTPYVQVDDHSPYGYWLEAVCKYSPLNDPGPLDVLLAHKVRIQGDVQADALRQCMRSSALIGTLAEALNKRADSQRITRGRFFSLSLLEALLDTHNYTRDPSGCPVAFVRRGCAREDWDEDAYSIAETLVNSGMNPVWLMATLVLDRRGGSPQSFGNSVQAAAKIGLPRTAAYFQSQIDQGPCGHNALRHMPAKAEDGRIDVLDLWFDTGPKKFLENGWLFRLEQNPAGFFANSPNEPFGKGEWTGLNTFDMTWPAHDGDRGGTIHATIQPEGCRIKWSNGASWGR